MNISKSDVDCPTPYPKAITPSNAQMVTSNVIQLLWDISAPPHYQMLLELFYHIKETIERVCKLRRNHGRGKMAFYSRPTCRAHLLSEIRIAE